MLEQFRQSLEGRHGDDGHSLRPRLRAQPQYQPRDDPKRARGPDEYLLEVIARVILDKTIHRREDRAISQYDLETQDHVAHHPKADHAIAAGVCRGIAAKGRSSSRTEVEWKAQIVLLDRLLQRLQRDPGLHHR